MKKVAKKIIKNLISQDKQWARLQREQVNSPIETIFNFPNYTFGLLERILNPKRKNYLGYAHPEFLNYGHAQSILKHAGIQSKKCVHIGCEHGLRCLYPRQQNPFEWYSDCSIVLTFNLSRRNILQSQGMRSEAIGPYIHYATDHSRTEVKKLIEAQYGRIHVAFPYNNLFGARLDPREYLRHLLANKHLIQYDTLLVSGRKIDYTEIDTDDVVFFSSGGINNPYFLDHLKFILNNAKSTSSNALSTALGYSIYLKKNHFVYDTKKEGLNVLGKQYDSITKNLVEFSCENTLIPKMWGFDSIKSKQELASILQI